MTTAIKTPTEEQIEALRLIKGGADITSPSLAQTLREIEKNFPYLIDITKRMGHYSVLEKLPYFGAIPTPDGDAAIEQLEHQRSNPTSTV